MPRQNQGTGGRHPELHAAVEQNRRVVLRNKALASELDQGFAALKDRKRTRQPSAVLADQAPKGPGPAEPAQPAKRTILLVEDHPIVSLGISELINYEPDLTVVGVAEDRLSALERVATLHPDLVVLDLTLKERSGLELLKEMRARFPRLLVLILSLHDEVVYAPRALRAGACGYVMKDQATETLLRAIHKVLDGAIYLSPALEAQATQPQSAAQASPLHQSLQVLTDRELEILQLIGEGKTSRDIAQVLCLSLKTVETHRTNLKHKLALENAPQLVQFAVQLAQRQ